jgi:transcriptional regulator with AAA-type ATPase domain
LNGDFVFPPAGFSLEEAIHRLIQQALKQSEHNVSAAARLLGVSRDYVRYRLEGQKTGDSGVLTPDVPGSRVDGRVDSPK